MKKWVSILLKSSIKILVILLFTMQASCDKSEYANLVKSEMDKNIVNDSLIFGIEIWANEKIVL